MITVQQSRDILLVMKQQRALREPYLRLWKMIAKWIDPLQYGRMDAESPPTTADMVSTKLMDTTISYYSQVFAMGLQGYTCSSQSAFFGLQPEDPEMWTEERGTEITKILQSRARKMYRMLARSNFYRCLNGFFKSFGDLGTAIMFFGTDDKGNIYFENVPVYQCVTIENRLTKQVDTLFRTLWLTRYEIQKMYGLTEDELPKVMKTADARKDYQKQYRVYQLFCPRDRFEMDLSTGFAHVSIAWVEGEEDRPIFEGGTDFQPFCVCAFGRSSDGTGLGCNSPGMRQVRGSKALQKILMDQLSAADLMSAPPIKKTENVQANIMPGGFVTIPPGGDIAPLQMGADLSWTEANAQKIARIAKADYFVDFFLMLSQYSGQVNTATLAQGLQNEQVKMMTFFLDVLKSDFFEPIIDWLYNTMGRSHAFDDREEIPYTALQVDYVSPLFRIQRQAVTIEPTSTAMQQILPYIQVDPTLTAYIDFHQYAVAVAEATGADTRIIRSEEEARAIIEAQQKAEQEARQREMDIKQQDADTKTMLAAKTASEPGSEASERKSPYAGLTLRR